MFVFYGYACVGFWMWVCAVCVLWLLWCFVCLCYLHIYIVLFCCDFVLVGSPCSVCELCFGLFLYCLFYNVVSMCLVYLHLLFVFDYKHVSWFVFVGVCLIVLVVCFVLCIVCICFVGVCTLLLLLCVFLCLNMFFCVSILFVSSVFNAYICIHVFTCMSCPICVDLFVLMFVFRY